RLHFQDIITKNEGLAGNAEHLDLADRRRRAGGVRIVSNRPGRHANATDFSAVEIEHRSVAQVVGNHEGEVVDEEVPIEMRAKIISGGTGAEWLVDGGIRARRGSVAK